MYMATSEALRKHSHGKGIDHIIQSAKEVIDYCLQSGVECRFRYVMPCVMHDERIHTCDETTL